MLSSRLKPLVGVGPGAVQAKLFVGKENDAMGSVWGVA